MKVGDLIYDEGDGKYAIVLEQCEKFPEPPGNCEIYYFYYLDGGVHQIWWDSYTDDRKEKIKVISSRESSHNT
mgnify:CR=1 FL=1|jgi:hypothetical protein|tara:strand:+ start:24 stop:242 length:219 start_codon:yes stop_codon:yes gene_type:complete